MQENEILTQIPWSSNISCSRWSIPNIKIAKENSSFSKHGDLCIENKLEN